MILRKIYSNKSMESQALPGFATIVTRPFILWGGCLVALALVLVIGGQNAAKEFTFEVPKAEAAASLAKGAAEPVFTQTQKRYIQRALNARHDNLYKLQGASVRAAFNDPGLIRSDAPTTVWQYRSNSCVLDVYFKAEGADVTYAPVVHYEVRYRGSDSGDVSSADMQACMKSLLPASGVASMLSVSAFYKHK